MEVKLTPTPAGLFGEYVRRKAIPVGMSVTDAAKRLGIGRPALSNMLNGKAALSLELAVKLDQVFGLVKASDLMAMQASSEPTKSSVLAVTKSYVPPYLQIKAAQIEAWADSIASRSRLAVFIRTLVNSTGVKLTKVDFPGNDDSERSGWDGQIEASFPSPWIPEGSSGWEFGVNKSPKAKADNDYAKSVTQNSAKDRAGIVFVFVTPRRWPGKVEWELVQRAKGQWKDVRAYDASDLEQWLEQSIPAQTWMAKELDIPNDGVYSLDACWREWADVTTPPMKEEVFAEHVAQDKAQEALAKLGEPTPTTIVITADSNDEALAYLYSAIPADKSHLKDRLVVFRNPGVLSKLISKMANFIPVITSREVEKEFAPFSANVSSVVIYPLNDTNAKPHIRLGQLSFQGLRSAIKVLGLSDDEVDRYARESGQSLTVLRRRLANSAAIQVPDWATNPNNVDAFIPFLLAGAWNTSNKADQEMLAKLANKPFSELEKDFMRLLRLPESPVWSVGLFQGICSKIDGLFAANHQITKSHLDRFYVVAEEVLSEDDPALDMPESERWTASIYGKKREISKALRDSISESLVLLSVHGAELFEKTVGVNTASSASDLIEKMLTPLTVRKLEAHSHDLPMYAEAAPDRFLQLLENDIASDGSETLKLMRPADSGVFGGCPRTGVLWALENLAWMPGMLRRTCEVLANLARPVIEDNWSNKPTSSLSYIFLWWMPQTSAPLDERKKVMDFLVKKYPKIAWPILVQQFNGRSTVGHYSHKPCWRSEGRGFGSPVTVGEGFKFLEYALDKALAWEEPTKETLTDLIGSYWRIKADFPEKASKIWDLVEVWAKTANEDDRATLREVVRVNTRTRRARKGRERDAGKDDKLAWKIYDLLKPADLILENAWLFKAHWLEESEDELEDQELDYSARDKRIEALRLQALQNILAKKGVEGIWALTIKGDAARTIGYLLFKIVTDLKAQAEMLKTIFDKKDEQHQDQWENLIYGMLGSVDGDQMVKLIRLVAEVIPTEDLVSFLILAPCNQYSIQALQAFSPEIQSDYWAKVHPGFPGRYEDGLSTIISRLIAVKRPRAAFSTTQFYLKQLQPQELFKLLYAMANESVEPAGTYQLDGYRLREALGVLHESGEIPQDEMAMLEFKYLAVLAHEGEIPNLERQIHINPDLFVQAVVYLYRRKDDKEDPVHLRPDPDHAQDLATGAHRLLDKLSMLPGLDSNGTFNPETFNNWVSHVRSACKELGRQDVADLTLGKLFANAPVGVDGVWPIEAARDALEGAMNEFVARGARVEFHNLRGVHWRGEGGAQERELAEKYASWANALEYTHPRLAAVLRDVAKGYEHEAREQDARADVRKRLGNY